MSEAQDEHREPLRELLSRAGQEALRRRGSLRIETKADTTRVTDADRAVEALLRGGLVELFPRDGVVGEEGTRVEGEATWYIDPIDGTNAYIEGLAYWGSTLARVVEGRLVLGATWFPRLDELWFADTEGAWCERRRLQPLASGGLDRRSVVYVPSRFHRWFDLDFAGRVRSLGSTSAHLALVAGGSARACFVPAGWAAWDAFAGFALLSRVGGELLDLEGRKLDPLNEVGTPFVAGAPGATEDLVRRIAFRARDSRR